MKEFLKKIIVIFLPLIILILIFEFSLRIVYFQMYGESFSATQLAFGYLIQKYSQKKAESSLAKEMGIIKNTKNISDDIKARNRKINKALFSDNGKNILDEFKSEYEKDFKNLIEESSKIKSKLVVMYLPSDDYIQSESLRICRDFYSSLAKKYELDFIDLTDDFLKYPADEITLLPENGHLSRLGNQIVTKKISEYLEKNNYQSKIGFENHPRIMGDLKPNDNSIWKSDSKMPYMVTTNNQGFRMNYDLTFPKNKQRLLFLGDSYTFGPYMENFDTFPGLLSKKYPDKEFINAGVSGYTITDEAELFSERAKFSEPDIIFLEVLDNDLPGFFSFQKNQFSRKKKIYKPSKIEVEFLKSISYEN